MLSPEEVVELFAVYLNKYSEVEVDTTNLTWGDQGFGRHWWDLDFTSTIVVNEHSIVRVDQVGGENQGGHFHFVWKVDDQYFIKSGYYDSEMGVEWDGPFKEVRPVSKTVVVYE